MQQKILFRKVGFTLLEKTNIYDKWSLFIMLTSSSVSMIKKAIQSKEQVFLSADNLPITFQTRLLKITQDFLVVYNAITPEYISKAITSRNFSLQIANLRFQAKKISSNGEHILFQIGRAHV